MHKRTNGLSRGLTVPIRYLPKPDFREQVYSYFPSLTQFRSLGKGDPNHVSQGTWDRMMRGNYVTEETALKLARKYAAVARCSVENALSTLFTADTTGQTQPYNYYSCEPVQEFAALIDGVTSGRTRFAKDAHITPQRLKQCCDGQPTRITTAQRIAREYGKRTGISLTEAMSILFSQADSPSPPLSSSN